MWKTRYWSKFDFNQHKSLKKFVLAGYLSIPRVVICGYTNPFIHSQSSYVWLADLEMLRTMLAVIILDKHLHAVS